MELFDLFYESPLQKVPETTGLTIQEAIYTYVFLKNKVIQIDTVAWPGNGACAY